MGNTVARSHIRDADPGVAKATRANTKRNSTGFTNDLAEVNADPVLPPTDGVAAAAQAPALPFGGKAPAIGQHLSKSIASARGEVRGVESYARKPLDQISQKAQFQPEQGLSHRANGPQDSTPLVSGSRLTFPERRAVTYASSSGADPTSQMAPDAVVGDLDELGLGPEHADMPPARHLLHSVPMLNGSGSTSASWTAPRSAPSSLSIRRRRERNQSGNISFSRNTSSQSLPARVNGTDSTQTRDLFDDDPDEIHGKDKMDDPQEDRFLAVSGRSNGPFTQRVTANIDPNLAGASIRECQNARTSTPPRVDKPPRARKVVSFNENVHVVTYANEGSSTHSSSTTGDTSSRHGEGKLVKKRARSVFRLLAKVAGPVGMGGQSAQSDDSESFDTCCGLRLTGVTELVYDEMSPKRKSRLPLTQGVSSKRLAGADIPLEVRGAPDLVVPYETARLPNATTSILRRPGFDVKVDPIVDDFDYCERKNSDGMDTLSLSDAHPSKDAIDEPEAIGDQLLSPIIRESQSESRIHSSFDIAPLWQRLKRVDELDVVKTPLLKGSSSAGEQGTAWLAAADMDDGILETGGEIADLVHDPVANRDGIESSREDTEEFIGGEADVVESSERSAVDASKAADGASGVVVGNAAIEGDVDEDGTDSASPLEDSSDVRREQHSSAGVRVIAPLQPHIRQPLNGGVQGLGHSSRDVDPTAATSNVQLDTEGVATVMYTASSAADLGSQSDRLSLIDPASDVDAVAAHEVGKSPREPEISDEALKVFDDVDSMPELQSLTARLSTSRSHLEAGFVVVHPGESKGEERTDPGSTMLTTGLIGAAGAANRDEESANHATIEKLNSAARLHEAQLNSLRRSSALLPEEDTSEASSSLNSNGAFDFGSGEGFFDSITRGSREESRMETFESDGMGTELAQNETGYYEYPADAAVPFRTNAPLAGVFYGTDSPPPGEKNHVASSSPGEADYPEYTIIKGQGNEDSMHGSETEGPLLRRVAGRNGQLNEVDLRDRLQNGVSCRQGAFEDRATKRPIPEVLLHDWSGRQPVEPSVEMVDSAPNSRSSITYIPSSSPKPIDQRPEYPTAALLLSARLNADMSKRMDGASNKEDGTGGDVADDKEVKVMGRSPGKNRPLITPEAIRPRSKVPLNMEGGTSGRTSSSKESTVGGGSEMGLRNGRIGTRSGGGGRFEGGASRDSNRPKPYFTSLPGVHPPDPKLQDFQLTVKRKSVSETGLRSGVLSDHDALLLELEQSTEHPSEPRSDFRTYSRYPPGQEALMRRQAMQSRRVVSNAETSLSTVVRDDGNALRGVVSRLVGRIQLARRLVTPGYR